MTARKLITLLGVSAFTLSALFPPWTTGRGRWASQGFDFIFDHPNSSMVDLPKLILVWAAIGGFTGMGLIFFWSPNPRPAGAESPVRLIPSQKPHPQETPPSEQPRQRKLNPEQSSELERIITELVSTKVPSTRQRQAKWIALDAVRTEAHAWLKRQGSLAGFDAQQSAELAIKKFSEEFYDDEDKAIAIGRPYQPPTDPSHIAWSFFGIGTRLYGKRDFRPDNSYVTTLWVCIFYFPIIPFASYRIIPGELNSQLYGLIISFSQNLVVLSKSFPNLRQVLNVYAFSIFCAAWFGYEGTGGFKELPGLFFAGLIIPWVILYTLRFVARTKMKSK